jgi:hypothetical protein
MKSTFILAAVGIVLFASGTMTNAQEPQQSVQPSARAKMEEDANASAQSGTDMSYGAFWIREAHEEEFDPPHALLDLDATSFPSTEAGAAPEPERMRRGSLQEGPA